MLENKWTLKIKQLQERIDYLESCLRAAGDNVQENQRLLKLAWEQIDRMKEELPEENINLMFFELAG
ncbi:hypothetical protein [Methanosarcina virus MetMV]|jgi:hypothetical protein|nr:hypothetical protein [Methanosarcina virus MetMV]AZF89994.1 hypothetical protein [Methanosarcina virus MetMV]